MRLVVDANVVISALASSGITREVFMFNSLVKRFEFIAPELLMRFLIKERSNLFWLINS